MVERRTQGAVYADWHIQWVNIVEQCVGIVVGNCLAWR